MIFSLIRGDSFSSTNPLSATCTVIPVASSPKPRFHPSITVSHIPSVKVDNTAVSVSFTARRNSVSDTLSAATRGCNARENMTSPAWREGAGSVFDVVTGVLSPNLPESPSRGCKCGMPTCLVDYKVERPIEVTGRVPPSIIQRITALPTTLPSSTRRPLTPSNINANTLSLTLDSSSSRSSLTPSASKNAVIPSPPDNSNSHDASPADLLFPSMSRSAPMSIPARLRRKASGFLRAETPSRSRRVSGCSFDCDYV